MGETDFFEVTRWGPNWTFRVAAEVIAVGIGTFVAASLAPGRERAAAVVGGLRDLPGIRTQTLGFIFGGERVVRALASARNDALAVVAAPLVGIFRCGVCGRTTSKLAERSRRC